MNTKDCMYCGSVEGVPHSENCPEYSASSSNGLLSRNGWGIRRHVDGEIIVSNKNGSFTMLQKGTNKNSVGVTESLFYDMMNDFLNDIQG